MNPGSDPVWDSAWARVMREHERESFDEAARAELVQWLAASPVHRQAYDEACRLWLLVGFVPPANDVEIPGCTPHEGE